MTQGLGGSSPNFLSQAFLDCGTIHNLLNVTCHDTYLCNLGIFCFENAHLHGREISPSSLIFGNIEYAASCVYKQAISLSVHILFLSCLCFLFMLLFPKFPLDIAPASVSGAIVFGDCSLSASKHQAELPH